ncbi:RtcB family protein [Methylocystis hirsuta]|uniref:RtcB family protein n=1 Tax=Methylocystis hirsuta TaxID=369798 RepID=UPI001FE1EA24|nr:RtcB family protein [Methylocystis hirsuta]
MGWAKSSTIRGWRGAIVKGPSMGGVAEEAPGAYEHVSAVMDSAQVAELAKKVAYFVPLICING